MHQKPSGRVNPGLGRADGRRDPRTTDRHQGYWPEYGGSGAAVFPRPAGRFAGERLASQAGGGIALPGRGRKAKSDDGNPFGEMGAVPFVGYAVFAGLPGAGQGEAIA